MKLSYNQIYRALFSSETEDYIPDGISISHPVIAKHNDEIVDSFLLYSMSRDGNRYSAPIARIIVEPVHQKLIEYCTVNEKPFSIQTDSPFFSNTTTMNDEELRAAEMAYQEEYLNVREIAFCNEINREGRNAIMRYLVAFKKAELSQLQPYLVELGADFFRWAKNSLHNVD